PNAESACDFDEFVMLDRDVDQFRSHLLNVDAERSARICRTDETLDVRRVFNVCARHCVKHQNKIVHDFRECCAGCAETFATNERLHSEEHSNLLRRQSSTGVTTSGVLRAMR